MPELPEVEYTRRQLEAWMRGRPLRAITAKAGTPLRRTSPKALQALVGLALSKVERRGKHLLLGFAWPRAGSRTRPRLGVYLHLGMSGKLVRRSPLQPPPRFQKVAFTVDGAVIYFCDARRFGRLRLVPGPELAGLPEVAALGPDAWLALPTARQLRTALGGIRRPIKVALLDQSLLAGVGNIQASEALWRARLAPQLPAKALDLAAIGALRRGIHATLGFTLRKLGPVQRHSDIHYVEEGGENWFKVYGRAGLPCRRDGSAIVRSVQAGRSTFACPTCQPTPGPARTGAPG